MERETSLVSTRPNLRLIEAFKLNPGLSGFAFLHFIQSGTIDIFLVGISTSVSLGLVARVANLLGCIP